MSFPVILIIAVVVIVAIAFGTDRDTKRSGANFSRKEPTRLLLGTYIRSLNFQFIETYSFNRGPKVEALLRENKFKGEMSFIADSAGRFDPTSEKIAVIEKNTKEFDRLTEIMSKPMGETMVWMCMPFYRDAMVLRDKDNKIVDVLNICFGCTTMQNTRGQLVEADQQAYEQLSVLFNSIGHNIRPNETDEFYRLQDAIKRSRNAKPSA